jgi:hypothetical protein
MRNLCNLLNIAKLLNPKICFQFFFWGGKVYTHFYTTPFSVILGMDGLLYHPFLGPIELLGRGKVSPWFSPVGILRQVVNSSRFAVSEWLDWPRGPG